MVKDQWSKSILNVKDYQVLYPTFSGERHHEVSRVCVIKSPAVVVLPYDPEHDQMVMVEQFRIGAALGGDSPWLLERVAGIIDEGDPLDHAKRELR